MELQNKVEESTLFLKVQLEETPNAFAACSFGKDSRVLIDLLTKIEPDFEFIGIDTGFEFDETITFGNSLADDLNLNFRWVMPSDTDRKVVEAEYDGSFVKNNQFMCCEMKIPAIESLFDKYDAWVTGLRRDETEFRATLPMKGQGKITKLNPLVKWTNEDIWDYIRMHSLKYHPLYDSGFTSLGCQPCTTKGNEQAGGGRQGQFERAGRFAGSQNEGEECGMHLL